jgi:hypothetical protein
MIQKVNGNGIAVYPNEAQELQTILSELRTTIQAMSDENKKLLDLVKFYANTDWRDLSMRDRGAAARQMVKEVNGR